MKRSYENGFLIFILFLTAFFSWRSFAQVVDKPCVIKKVFHHRGVSESSAYVEAGSLVLYLDTMPRVVPSPTVALKGDIEIQTFFLPLTTVSGEECKRMIDRVNKDKANSYTVAITSVSVPTKGVSISISYRKGLHSVECKRFEAIGGDKGLIFYVYNQKMLDALRMRREPLIQTASSGRHPPRIFIDNGHGGSDTGAIGYKDVQEKTVCLHVGKHLARLLKKNGYDVVLSRSTDKDVALDQRTTAANRAHADMLISIHANAGTNSSVHGVETFCMIPSLLTHMYANRDLNGVDSIIAQRAKKSCAIASSVQKNICSAIAPYQTAGFDRGVKHAVAQVFFAQMPAILVELGFLTNPHESNLLATDSYQCLLAEAIFRGISENF